VDLLSECDEGEDIQKTILND